MNNIIYKFLKPKAAFVKWFLFIFLVLILLTVFLGFFEPIKDFLSSESLSFQIGNINFSLYIIIKGFIYITLLLWITGIISEFGEKYIKNIKGVKSANKSLITKTFQIILYFIVFLIMLDVIGIDLTTLTVFGGAIGIGIGFGLQKVTANFISGLILLLEKSVESEDLVELSDGTYGFIRSTNARYTLLETFEGKEVMIPNEDFITNRVTNWTFSNTKGRIEINVGVSYNSNIEKAHQLILEAAKEHTRCIADPEPVCYLTEFGDSSVNFILFFWVEDVTAGRLQAKSEVMFSIWNKFKKNKIEIPFPQRDVHIKEPVKILEGKK